MGTTANFSWPYPESTDYVADGATAIENLADAIDTTLAPRARGKIGQAQATGTPILSNVIAITDIPGLSLSVTTSTSKVYLFVVTGFVIQSAGSPTQTWLNLSVRDSGVKLVAQQHIFTFAYGNQVTLIQPYIEPSYNGARTLVASIEQAPGTGQLDLYGGATNPWTFAMYEMGDL
jgi:hypothetical protein